MSEALVVGIVRQAIELAILVSLPMLAAGLIAGIGGVTLTFGDDFELGGIALGTILVIVFFHMVKGRGSDSAGSVTRNLSHPDYDGGVDDAASGGTAPR